ncbi:MAG TPA: alcohol dehydrogenase catalytic domain-containing protein [Verrucomicrobiota bacterium]|mgnify:CR=1 FL=1|jgi:threonine dehydrogenase-like Zn-dependent dehydrogenase|nr:alcohol dehydrogenase catalytic domain-containing protein [Verrucomicrobiota bacterium]HRT07318.1 alcohol dehydrogenase catalytic domain-containing protein [Candidatus Paceibacterota bacterium]HRT58140.1 alcohol dehydrogenase catalytic domain-containing protein [Candidatus Paceibacterota bacterium]
MNNIPLPQTQRAVQLVGPDQLRLNAAKPVFQPGPRQILGRVEVVGLCFSDLKLLKQFSGHARKSEVASGIERSALAEMPNYVPGDKPTVPGHETVVRIVKVGSQVTRYKPGERYLVQTDYRWLPTAGSASAFGYNFEGALQEYVLMDERVITAPDGESMLIPVPEDLSASALALCEPWACVEDSYVEKQRQTLKAGGQLLVVGESPVDPSRVRHLPGQPANTTFATADQVAGLKDAAYDDVIYFGANPQTVERLFPKVAVSGLFNIVQGGQKFGRPVVSQVGRVHYGGIRLIGTPGSDPAAAMRCIPPTAEIRPNNRINIIGAAGPMGTMHVIRDLCQGVPGVTVYAGDLSDERLAVLEKLAGPVARKNGLVLRPYNPSKDKLAEKFDYIVLMAPVPALVVQAIPSAAPHAIINIFAGIPANVTAELDLDAYIEKALYFIGTSGSTLEDMKLVLSKVVSRQLDTNLSVAAVSGLEGAIDGIRAVEKNLMPGKILVYPACKGLRLTALPELEGRLPLDNGRWTREAEDALVKGAWQS